MCFFFILNFGVSVFGCFARLWAFKASAELNFLSHSLHSKLSIFFHLFLLYSRSFGDLKRFS
jgi:hypothetical protein